MSWTERYSGNNAQRPNDTREPYQRDKARVLHSAAFRRLQAKTQILGVGNDDFYRTRLTHSLEVAQIGLGVLSHLKGAVSDNSDIQEALPSDALIETICLAHDIGHPPFGHGGETALNFLMHKNGGFEGNGQTLRIVSKLEPYTESHGMDLTRRTLLGLIKYPQIIRSNREFEHQVSNLEFIKPKVWKPTKGLFAEERKLFNWILTSLNEADKALFLTQKDIDEVESNSVTPYVRTSTAYKSLDASIMELADDIAYAVHDLEDAIVLNKVAKSQWQSQVLPQLLSVNNPWIKKHGEQLTNALFSDVPYQRKNAIGALVNHLITNSETYVTHESFSDSILKYNARLNDMAAPLLELLKVFVFQNVINSTDIQHAEFKGQQILIKMFTAFLSDPYRLLPLEVSQNLRDAKTAQQEYRLLCDYLALMSDVEAMRLHHQLFG